MMNQIKLQINECARIMNELSIDEDAIDFIDDIALIMNACAIMIHNDIYEIKSIHEIDMIELNYAFESLQMINLHRFI